MNLPTLFRTACLFFVFHLTAEEIAVRTPSGDNLTLQISTDQSFGEVIQQIDTTLASLDSSFAEASANPYLSFVIDYQAGNAAARNYYNAVTQNERNDIYYIVTSLARNSWAQLLTKKSSLDRAGDRIDNVHPLRFLLCIFSDEEMKASIQAIRESKIIWKEFTAGSKGGLFTTLEEESKNNNLRKEFVQDFAAQLNVDYTLLMPFIVERQWKKLVDTLIKVVPRKGGGPGYDM